MKMNEAFPGKYLKQEDFEPERTLTIKGSQYFDVSQENEPAQNKPGLLFEEEDRALIMNKTNWEALANILGSSDSDNWVGKKATFYRDPSVRFGSKVVGGVKVKEASQDDISF